MVKIFANLASRYCLLQILKKQYTMSTSNWGVSLSDRTAIF